MSRTRSIDQRNKIIAPAIALAVLGFVGMQVGAASAAVPMALKVAESQTTNAYPQGAVQVAAYRKTTRRRAHRRSKRKQHIRSTARRSARKNFQDGPYGYRNLREEWCLDCGP